MTAMGYFSLVTVLAVASSAMGAGLLGAPAGTDSVGVRSGLIPGFSSNNGNFESASSDGTSLSNLQQQRQQQRPQQQPGQIFFQSFPAVSGNGQQSFGSVGQVGQGFSASFAVAGVQPSSVPKYEEHIQVNSGVRPVTTTITNTVTQTHTLRVPSTSDVWVTSVTMMKMPVTQLSTQRSYVPVAPNTVTSVIRITKTPIEVVTRTEEVYPTKTLVSVFTRFVTETETVELWQNIVHRATNYEVLTVPVVETQTLLQRLFSTITVTRVVNITSVQQPLFTQTTSVRSGEVPAAATYAYARY